MNYLGEIRVEISSVTDQCLEIKPAASHGTDSAEAETSSPKSISPPVINSPNTASVQLPNKIN